MLLRLFFILFCVTILGSCSGTSNPPAQPASAPAPSQVLIGGEPVITLQRQKSAADSPQFVSLQVFPGRGMNLFQVRAYWPGKGELNLMGSPSLEDAAKILNTGSEDFYDLKSATMGGAILVPYANRIRGKLSADGKTVLTKIAGKDISLPANMQGKQPGAEKVAIHGLIMDAKFQDVKVTGDNDQSNVSAILHGGNFDGHWFSQTDVRITTSLSANAVEMDVEVTNAGDQPLPASVGWHPYFIFPSSDRQQGRLHIPAKRRAVVDNYDQVLPTGKTVPVAGTPYDFTAAKGAPLGTLFLDDSFIDLDRKPDGSVVSEITDPKAGYGLRVVALSREIHAIQAYSPPEKGFLALEPQFNYADPYGKEWGHTDTGMVILKPGQSVTYRVRLELFVPN